MRTLWRGIVRVGFWAYERGTWQYDIAVGLIACFVLFSPRIIHFNDQPAVGPPASQAQIQLRQMAPGRIATYRVDARLIASPMRTPEFEHDLHTTVQNNIPDLRSGGFEITHVDPIWGADGNIAYYDVSVKP